MSTSRDNQENPEIAVIYKDSFENSYLYVDTLSGQGQTRVAGFFIQVATKEKQLRPDKYQEFLIKADKPATCVQECSAHFVKNFIPEKYINAINLARIDSFSMKTNLTEAENKMVGGEVEPQTPLLSPTVEFPEDEETKIEEFEIEEPPIPLIAEAKRKAKEAPTIEKPTIVSIQQKVKNSIPLAVVILGVQRDPKTLFSIESKNTEKILSHIAGWSDSAKTDLAVAIFASAFVGDESLHIGQYMAICDENKNVEHIVRIDLGARDRHSLLRMQSWDFEHKTSQPYASSGQFGKHYMNYLLKDPDVRAKYMQLWIRSKTINADAKDLAIRDFRESMSKIPDEQKQKTLENVYKIYAKGSGHKIKNITQVQLEKIIGDITTNRIKLMQDRAIIEVNNLLVRCDIQDRELFGIAETILFHPNDLETKEENIQIFLSKLYDLVINHQQVPLNDYSDLTKHVKASLEFSNLPDSSKKNLLTHVILLQKALSEEMIHNDIELVHSILTTKLSSPTPRSPKLSFLGETRGTARASFLAILETLDESAGKSLSTLDLATLQSISDKLGLKEKEQEVVNNLLAELRNHIQLDEQLKQTTDIPTAPKI